MAKRQKPPLDFLRNAQGEPVCAYCGKKIRKWIARTIVPKGDSPTIFQPSISKQFSDRYHHYAGRKIIRIVRRKPAFKAYLPASEQNKDLDEIGCFLGQYLPVYGYFCKQGCAAHFGEISFNGGMRRAKVMKAITAGVSNPG